jgi:hypothetical protein
LADFGALGSMRLYFSRLYDCQAYGMGLLAALLWMLAPGIFFGALTLATVLLMPFPLNWIAAAVFGFCLLLWVREATKWAATMVFMAFALSNWTALRTR